MLADRNKLAARGFNLLAIDTPGVGEALRIGRIFTRYDYEVPVRAAVDYLESRQDVEPGRIGITAAASVDTTSQGPRRSNCDCEPSSHGSPNYDYHAVWHRRITVGGSIAAPMFQLMYITGTETMDAAMNHIREFRLEPIAHRISCPFLVAHGIEDQQISIDDAKRMFEAIGSKDKELKIFTGENGGAAHCQFDN